MEGIRQTVRFIRSSSLKYNIRSKDPLHNIRSISYLSKEYDEKNDPAPHFFNQNIQQLLLELTRPDLQIIFRKRETGKLQEPTYEFLTDQQLEEKMREIRKKALDLLQFPPAVSIRKPRDKIFSQDPALKGFESSKFVFTDITFGTKDSERLIVVRHPDGTLKEADWETRGRLNQLYFPIEHRQLKTPKLFEDSYLEDLLNRKEFLFVLNLACQQFEPDDPDYQRVVSITYQCINDNNHFELLRSTRHFGSLTFFLVWNKMVDNLLLDLIENCHLEEAKKLIELYCKIHRLQYEDGDGKVIENFIKNHSNKRAVLELALQATYDFLKQKQVVEDGIKKAHGLG